MTDVLFRQGRSDASILVICEPPDEDAFYHRRAFTDSERSFFLSVADGYGFEPQDFAFLPCAAPMPEDCVGDRDQSEHLAAYRAEVLRKVEECDPELIIAMGKHALRQVSGRAVQIGKSRGQIQEYHGVPAPVLPMFGVRQCLWFPENISIFVTDFNMAATLDDNGYDPRAMRRATRENTDYRWCLDLSELEDDKPNWLAVDTETTGLKWTDPNVRVLTVQLTPKVGKSLVVPVDMRAAKIVYPEEGATSLRRKVMKARAQLKRLLTDNTIRKIGHNIKFDHHQIRETLGYKVQGWFADTQQLAFVVDDNMVEKSLDEVTRRWCPAMAGYADAFNRTADKSDMLGELRKDPDNFLLYAAQDTDANYRCARSLVRMAQEDEDNWRAYRYIQLPALLAFADKVEPNGLNVDLARLSELEETVGRETAELHTRILSQIPASIRRAHLRKGLSLTRRDLVADALFRPPYGHPDGLSIRPLFFTKGTRVKPDEEKVPTVGKDHLIYFGTEPLVEGVLRWSKLNKMRGTYVGKEYDPEKQGPTGFWKHVVHKDGRTSIFPSFFLHRTSTGRTACVHEDTLITTQRGEVPIKAVQPNDMVWTHKGRWRPIVRGFIKPVQRMWDVHLSNGEVLRTAEEHRILTENGWESVRNVCLKKAGIEPGDTGHRDQDLHNVLENRFGDSEGSRGIVADVHPYPENLSGPGGLCAPQSDPLQLVKDGNEEPAAREKAAQPQGGLPGWVRVLNARGEWPALFCPSDSVRGTGVGDTSRSVAGNADGPSYRRGHNEQRAGQPSGNDGGGARKYPSTVSTHTPRVTITGVVPVTSHRVFDVEVADDHSYMAGGIFHHNSADPNAQNFPKRGDLAKAFRSIFVAPPGWKIIEADLSQAELRIAACQANEPTMIRLYNEGMDIHMNTAAAVSRNPVELFIANKDSQDVLADREAEFNGAAEYLRRLTNHERATTTVANFIAMQRFRAKAVNFGFLYGMQGPKFRIYAKTDYGIEYTEREAREVRDLFFQNYPGLVEWHYAMEREVFAHGYVRSLHGAMRRLPSIYSSRNNVQQECVRQAINSPIQRFASDLGVIALWRLCRDCPDWIRPCAFIHDALLLYVREDRAEEAASNVRWYMESTPLEEWFGLDLQTPILADASIGTRLSHMDEVSVPSVRPEWYQPEYDEDPQYVMQEL